jgi:hypothetical protein
MLTSVFFGKSLAAHNHKKALPVFRKGLFCRGGGIRTPGTSRYNGFQDRRDRPLCHSSNSCRLVIEFAKIGD